MRINVQHAGRKLKETVASFANRHGYEPPEENLLGEEKATCSEDEIAIDQSIK